MIAEIITNKELREKYVEDTFKGDKDLFEKYHIVKGSEEDCINDTISKIEEFYDNEEVLSYNFYGLKEEEKTVGYFTKCEVKKGLSSVELLHSFGININQRNKKTFKKFMEILENFFDDRIIAGLYKKNTRAISFLEKNHFLITEIEEDYLFLSKRL